MIDRKKANKGGELITKLHPGKQTVEILDEKTAYKLNCIGESVKNVISSAKEAGIPRKDVDNYLKCAIMAAFMLGKISILSEDN